MAGGEGRASNVGGIGTLALIAPVALGACWAIRRLLPGATWAIRLLGAAVLGWVWLTLGTIGLGAGGWLTRPALGGWSCLGLALALLSIRKPLGTPEATRPAPREHGLGWPARLALGLTVAMGIPYLLTSLLGPVKVVSDAPIYHLYFAARWWQAARLFLVPVPFGESAATYFPAGGDVWFTWLFVGWGGDTLAKIGQVPFLLLAALAVVAIARELGAHRDAAVLSACVFASSTPLVVFSFEGNVDTIFVAGYLIAVLFFVRAWRGDHPRVSWCLGALAAGAAWGTKPTATVFIPPLLAIAALGIVWSRRPGWRGSLALLAVGSLLPGGFWFARNAWLTGNPLYPLDLPALGWVGWYGSEVMRQSPYYMPRGDLRALGDTLLGVLDPRLIPFWLASLVGVWRFGVNRTKSDDFVWFLAGVAILNVALYWIFIPYRTQQRFFLQAVGLAAVPLARLLDRAAGLRWLGLAFLAVHLLSAQSWPFGAPGGAPPWDLSPVVPNRVGPPLPLGMDGNPLGIALLILACLATSAVALGPLLRRDAWRFSAAVAGFLAIAVTWGFAGLPDRIRVEPFYPPFPDYLAGWLRLEDLAGEEGTRVAYAGTNIPYYLLGRGLRNDVRYVNVDRHRDWLMHDYHRQAIARGEPHWRESPRPGWDRQSPDRAAWLENLRDAKISYLVVTRVNPGEGPHNVADAEWFPIEAIWVKELPSIFAPIYGVGADSLIRIYRFQPGKT